MTQRTGNSKIAVVGWGRGMGHKGHMYLASSVITQASKMKADPYFFVSKTVGKDDPIYPEEKVKIYQTVFPQQAPIFQPQGNLNQALTDLASDGYQGVVLVVGADQKDAFKYLENPNKEGVPVYQSMGLQKLKVISRQETGDASSGLEGPRATPMREVLLHPEATEEQKFKVWRDAMPDALGDKEVMDLMKKAEARLMGSRAKKTKVAESRIMDRDAKVNAYYVSRKGDKHRVAENIPYYLLDKLVPLLTKKYAITMNDIVVKPVDSSQYRRTNQPELAEGVNCNPNDVAELLYNVKPEIFSRFGDDFVMDAITQACEQHQGSAQEVAHTVVDILKQGISEAYDHNAPFNAADFNRHMEQLRAREELRKTDPMKALVGDLIDKEHEKERLSKRKPQDDDSMSTSDPRHPQYAYTQAGHHNIDEDSDLPIQVHKSPYEGSDDEHRYTTMFLASPNSAQRFAKHIISKGGKARIGKRGQDYYVYHNMPMSKEDWRKSEQQGIEEGLGDTIAKKAKQFGRYMTEPNTPHNSQVRSRAKNIDMIRKKEALKSVFEKDPEAKREFERAGGYEAGIDVMGWQVGWAAARLAKGDTMKQAFQKLYYGGGSSFPFSERAFKLAWVAYNKHYGPEAAIEESPEEALKYATKAHSGQTRSGGDPYITHPMRVADHIRKYKQSHNLDALISAAYLHDTIEDTDTTQEVLHDLFGGLVASLVKELTSDPEQIKKMGKAAYLSHKMAAMSSYGLVIKLADRLDNVKDITTARTPQWRAKYAAETNQILDYIEKTRALSGTHNKLISLIRAKLAEIDNPQQGVAEGIVYNTLNIDNQNLIDQKAKSKPDGIYTFRGIMFRVRNGRVTHYAAEGSILASYGNFNTAVSSYSIRDEAKAKLKSIKEGVAEAEGISRRGILKGLGAVMAAGAAGKASAIAGAFPTPSAQQAMYKAAADSNRAEAKRQAELKAKADAERLQKNTDQVDQEQRVNHHKLDEFAPGNGDDGLPYAEYQVYQCNPEDQFDWIGGPLYQTDNMGMAHKYAYEKYVKHRPKAFMVWQERSQGSRGNYGVKGQSDGTEDNMTESSDYLDEK